MKIVYDSKLLSSILHTKFVEINIDSALPWTTHSEQLIPELSTSCYVIRSIKLYVSHAIVIIIY